MIFRLSFLAVSFWFLIGLSSGWWLHKLFNENNLRYQSVTADKPADQNAAVARRNRENQQAAKPRKERDSIQQWFADGDYGKILLYYEGLDRQGTRPQEAEKVRQTLLVRVESLLERNPERALSILKKYEQIDAYDPTALFLMARAHLLSGRHMEAIDIAARLNTFVQDKIGEEQIANLIDEAEVQYSEKIKQSGHFDKLIELYEKLSGYNPRAVYYYRLAEAQKKLNLFEDAINSLEQIAYDGSWGKQARDLASVIQQQKDLEGGISVPVERVGDHFIVTASINGIPGVRLLIDTGASLCGLRPNIAESLGVSIDYDNEVVINLAVGMTSVPTATVDLFEVGEARLSDLKINVIEMPIGISEDGLLGMNFLGRFNWLINQEENVLYLDAK